MASVLVAALSLTTPGAAETVATVNGVAIDGETLALYLQSRTQKPAAQATDEERAAILQELQDLYLLSTQPKARDLENDPRIKAQIELGYRGALAQAVAQDYISSNPASEEEIVAEYNEQIALAPDRQFKARHILVETQSAANDLISQLDDGADFATLATEHSTGPSGPSGGDLGWFSPNQMVKPFSDAVAALDDGAYTSAPVQTEFGWHVILREDSRTSEPPPLDSVRDRIKQRVEQKNFQRYVEGLRNSSGG
jgi:peptidyl-prolyl cis-trans isomerase C